ncbi:MAG: hypothetical protein WDN24_17690 [Sphingomonas sp.]
MNSAKAGKLLNWNCSFWSSPKITSTSGRSAARRALSSSIAAMQRAWFSALASSVSISNGSRKPPAAARRAWALVHSSGGWNR